MVGFTSYDIRTPKWGLFDYDELKNLVVEGIETERSLEWQVQTMSERNRTIRHYHQIVANLMSHRN